MFSELRRCMSGLIMIALCLDVCALKAAFSLSPSILSEQLLSENFDATPDGWIFPDSEHVQWEVMKTAGKMDFAEINPSDAGSLRIKGAADFADRELADAISPTFEIEGTAICRCYVGFSHDFDDMGALEIAAVDRLGNASLLWSSLKCTPHDEWEWHRLELPFTPRVPGTYRLRFRYTSGRLGAAITTGGCQASFYVDDIELSVREELPGEGANIEVGETVTFYNHTDGKASLQWSFPGGMPSSSTEENPTVTYKSPGIYDVTLKASDGMNTDVCKADGFVTVDAVAPSVVIVSQSQMRAEGSGHYALPPGVPLGFTTDNPDNLTKCSWHISSGSSDYDRVVRNGKDVVIEFYDEGERTIVAQASNNKGECRAELIVDVVKRARMANVSPEIGVELLPMSKVGTELAETFPQPPAECAIDNVNLLLTDIKASSSASAEVAIAYLKNGLPDEIINKTMVRLSELKWQENGVAVPLNIEFSAPVVVEGKPWAIILKLSGVTDFNVASVADETAHALTSANGEWSKVEGRSFRFSPSCTYSVLRRAEGVGSRVEFLPGGSAADISFMSLLSCRYITDADWVKAKVESEWYDYTIHLEAEPLPLNKQQREADFVVTDGISNLVFRLCQNSSGQSINQVESSKLLVFSNGVIRLLNDTARMAVWRTDGTPVAGKVREAYVGRGVYIVEVADAEGNLRFFRLVL